MNLAGFDIETLAFAFLAMIAAGGIAYVFLYPMLSGELVTEKRAAAVTAATGSSIKKSRANAEISKREQVLQSLKELEDKQKKSKTPPIHVQIQQAGLTWTKRGFIIFSIVAAVVLGLGGWLGTGKPLVGLAGLFVGGLGVPRWYLGYKRNQRIKAFANEFPNALDVIVRGVKAGLPLGDCIRMIANEASEPVKGEFRQVVETQAMGMALPDAVSRIYDRMPCSEANFFGIVIAIQAKAGGNLSEALGNLSKVLRERKKMREKIKAVSTEAKASAAIIGSLPVVVMSLVYLTTPKYIALLWETNHGNIMIAISLLWMATGIAVMKKMIAFDF
jgi:tight adherence protein B